MSLTTTSPRTARGSRSGRRAQALVEFVFILPTFITLLMAIFDFGYLLFIQNTVHHALREGLRVAEAHGSRDQILIAVRNNAVGVPLEGKNLQIDHGIDEFPIAGRADTVTVSVSLEHEFFVPWWHSVPMPIHFTLRGHMLEGSQARSESSGGIR